MTRTRAAILAHLIASYLFGIISEWIAAHQAGLDVVGFLFFRLLTPQFLVAPFTLPYILAVDLGLGLQGNLRPWQILAFWSEYLIPFGLFYWILRSGRRRGFGVLNVREPRGPDGEAPGKGQTARAADAPR